MSRLFRKYLSDLLDYMFTYEGKIIEKISKKFNIENEELIENGLDDLHNKLLTYEKNIEDERKKNLILENKLKEEQYLVDKKEKEIVEIDTINSFNMMMINQLKIEKENNIKRMRNIKSSLILEDDSINYTEMRMIKEKYMKPVQVYLLHPDYYLKLLERQKKYIRKNEIKQTNSENVDNILGIELDISENIKNVEDNKNKDITLIDYLINNINSYRINFNCIFDINILESCKENELNTNLINLDKDELLYFYFTFGKKIIKSNDMYLIDTKWVIDKNIYQGYLNQ